MTNNAIDILIPSGMVIMLLSVLVLFILVILRNDRVKKYQVMAVLFALTGYSGMALAALYAGFVKHCCKQKLNVLR